MVSKNQIKLITSLQQKKYRKQHNLFIAEGFKVISELLKSDFTLHHLYETESLFTNVDVLQKSLICESDIKKISALTTAPNCLALFEIPSEKSVIKTGLILALDNVRDPGNLGTIIRLCDWFGVEQILCSKETVGLYNPKVIQATMGSISRVQMKYCDLVEYLSETSLPIFGTFMDGENIYKTDLPNEAVLVMGNEANGISKPVEDLIKTRVSIPRFSKLQQTESLNVSTATAIFLSEFKRPSGK